MALRLRAWLIWLVTVGYFFYDYLHQVAPNVMSQGYRHSFGASASDIGLIASAYYYSYAIMQIPIGLIVDHFGPRRPLTVAALVAASFSLWLSSVDTTLHAAVLRFFIGAGAGFSFVTCLKCVSIWFPNRFAGRLTGLTNMVGMIGAISAGAPLAMLDHHIGWRHAMQGIAALGYLLAILAFITVKDHPSNDELQNSRGLNKSWQDIKHILSNRNSWINAAYAMLINLGFPAIGALWGTTFLNHHYQMPLVQAALINSMIFVGAIPGSVFFGWLSDTLQRRKLPMMLASVGALITLLCLIIGDCNQWQLFALFLLLGFFCCGNVIAYAYSMDIRPPGSAGVSLGFVNTALIAGSALSQVIIGFTIKHTDMHFIPAFTGICVLFALSLVLAGLLKETHCQLQSVDELQFDNARKSIHASAV